MRLILVRHGNTFAPGDKVVWIGARTDLSLAEKGIQQAKEVAVGLRVADLIPSRIYAGPLKRTAETAKIVARTCGLPAQVIVVSEELREIDYGRWEGLSNEEIRSEVGDQAIDGWQRLSIWPEGFDWKPSETEVFTGWNRLVDAIRHDNPVAAVVLVVSSNGIFRLIGKALGLAAVDAKMGTGSVAHLVIDDGSIKIAGWNLDPAKLSG